MVIQILLEDTGKQDFDQIITQVFVFRLFQTAVWAIQNQSEFMMWTMVVHLRVLWTWRQNCAVMGSIVRHACGATSLWVFLQILTMKRTALLWNQKMKMNTVVSPQSSSNLQLLVYTNIWFTYSQSILISGELDSRCVPTPNNTPEGRRVSFCSFITTFYFEK